MADAELAEQVEAAAEVPSFMRAEPLPDDLVIDDEGRVRLATAPRLIERLVYPARFDDNGKFDHRLCAALLLTYRSFYSPHQLLQALLDVYDLEPPAELAQLSAEEHSSWEAHWTWEAQRLLPVQLMICNVLQKWITNYLYDGDLGPELIDGFRAFTDGPLANNLKLAKFGTKLKSALEKKASRARQSSRVHSARRHRPQVELSFSVPPPQLLFPPEGTFTMYDSPVTVEPLEWARQLTCLEFALFQQLQPKELLHLAWAKKDKEMRAPNVLALIHHFNTVSNWVASCVLARAGLEERVDAYIHMVDLGYACFELGNFNAMQEVAAGLELSAVHRLRRTKEALPAKQLSKLETLDSLCSTDANRKAYRQALSAATPPCIPYLGVYLTDLTFLDEGNPDRVKHRVGEGTGRDRELELINWRKHQSYAAIIEDIRFYQQTHYNLARCEPLQSYLNEMMADTVLSVDEQYARSLEIEPRGQPSGAAAQAAASARNGQTNKKRGSVGGVVQVVNGSI